MKTAAGVFLAAIALAAGCGGGVQAFSLSARDNDPAQLRAALDKGAARGEAAPMAADGKNAVYVATGKKQADMLFRFDLDGLARRWEAPANLASRVVVGGDFVAFADRERTLVGLDSKTGARRFSAPFGAGTLRGIAADARRVFAVVERAGGRPAYDLTAYDGTSGKALWSVPAPGELGAPAARNGLVFVPYQRQWVVILDAATGARIARLRSDDEEVAFVRSTSTATYFGSKGGAYLLDDKAAAGTRAGATYGEAKLPGEFVRSFYHFDAFDPIQVGYSAYDRNRLLWRGQAAADGWQFADDVVVVHTYKFFFGFRADKGELAWAVSLPRTDAVASSHLGAVIGFVTATGEVGALEPGTGQGRFAEQLDIGERRVVGATFDADGWRPTGDFPVDTSGALAAIVRDRDARFTDVKLFAVSALAARDEQQVAGELLSIALEPTTPARVYDKTVQVLVARKDPSGLPALLDALETTYDYIEDKKPRAVDVVARAIAAIGDLSRERPGVSDDVRLRVIDRLSAHLFDPRTEPAVGRELIVALGRVGLPGAFAPLRTYLLTYRADPAFARQMAAVGATIDALVAGGGAAERAVVAFVASDAATEPGIAEYATRALRDSQRSAAPRANRK